jgi:hypothetical protein
LVCADEIASHTAYRNGSHYFTKRDDLSPQN